MGNRVSKTTYTGQKEILKFNEFVATVVNVDDVGVVANADGKKIVLAGTIVGGKTKPVLKNVGEVVTNKNTAALGAAAEGVLLYDVDVTAGPREGSMVIWGFIDLAKIVAPVAEVVLPRITFMY